MSRSASSSASPLSGSGSSRIATDSSASSSSSADHDWPLLEYPRAGHYVGALIPYYPENTGGTGDGYTPDDNQVARADAWPKLLRFLASI